MFAGPNNVMTISDTRQIRYCSGCNLSASVALSTTPFGPTHGFRKEGYWDEKVGFDGSTGGSVVYCDGHITWLDGDKPARWRKGNGG
jgi:hypothetical protein